LMIKMNKLTQSWNLRMKTEKTITIVVMRRLRDLKIAVNC